MLILRMLVVIGGSPAIFSISIANLMESMFHYSCAGTQAVSETGSKFKVGAEWARVGANTSRGITSGDDTNRQKKGSHASSV